MTTQLNSFGHRLDTFFWLLGLFSLRRFQVHTVWQWRMFSSQSSFCHQKTGSNQVILSFAAASQRKNGSFHNRSFLMQSSQKVVSFFSIDSSDWWFFKRLRSQKSWVWILSLFLSLFFFQKSDEFFELLKQSTASLFQVIDLNRTSWRILNVLQSKASFGDKGLLWRCPHYLSYLNDVKSPSLEKEVT